MSVAIRQAKKDDVVSIVRLYAEVTELMHALSPPGFGRRLAEPLDMNEEKERFTHALDDDKTVVLVAE